ncbi:MAG: hypothetical protein PUF12_11485 [Thermoflexaceae bacterium]|nr:hypothetical protein [Thermoflexaceae bacterium]
MIHYLIQVHFGTLIIITFMLIFISTNQFFEKSIIQMFRCAAISVLILVLVDSVEYWTASMERPSDLRIWMSAIGYTLRPTIIFMIVLLLLRGKKRKKFLMAVPLVINAIVAFSAFFTDIAYCHDGTGLQRRQEHGSVYCHSNRRNEYRCYRHGVCLEI